MVAAILNPLPPLPVFQIPLHGFTQPGFKGFFWLPAQFTLNLAGINGVAQVVAWAVLYKGNQLTVGTLGRHQILQQVAQRFHYFKIRLLVMPADIIGFTYHAFGDDLNQRTGVVFYI